jgi:hypothetical protein
MSLVAQVKALREFFGLVPGSLVKDLKEMKELPELTDQGSVQADVNKLLMATGLACNESTTCSRCQHFGPCLTLAASCLTTELTSRDEEPPPPPPAAPPPSQTKNAATPRERRPGEQKQLTMFEALPAATRMYASSAAAAQARRAADAPRTQEEMEAQAGLEVVKFPSEKVCRTGGYSKNC